MIILCLLFSQAAATNYYVDPSGNDSQDGLTPANAWLTINNGDAENNDILVAGDSVFILSGIYELSEILTISSSGTGAAPIVYHGMDPDNVILDLQKSANTDIVISGSHINFENLAIFNALNHGIHLEGDSILLAQCHIHEIGQTPVDISGNYNLVQKNMICCDGIQGISVNVGAESNKIYGNTIIIASGVGIGVAAAISTTRIFNNIIVSTTGIRANSGTICAFNNVFSSGQAYTSGVADSAGGISADPLIADTASENYTIMVGSPCIDAGIDLGYSYNQAAPDMGAFEKYSVYYVSASGSDTNDGLTPGSAWATIDNGDSILLPGDSVHVLSGTYTDSVYIEADGAYNDNIVFKGVRDSTTIIGNDFDNAVFIDADFITWSGISIDSSTENNLKISGDSVIIEYSRFENASKYGIYVSKSDYTLITKSIISNNNVHGLFITANTNNPEIYNTTIYNNISSGIFDQSGSANIVNCIIQGSGESAIKAPSNSSASYTDFYNNSSLVSGGITLDSTSIYDDPLLIEPDSGDFHLASLSPAIDAGIDLGLPYSGNAPDMGAYEVSGTLASIFILPVLDTLSADSVYQFTINGLDSSGSPTSPGVITWGETFATGSINSSGLFTPLLIGDGKIIATSSIGGIADTTELMTVISGSLDSIYITPDRDTIEAGFTRQFTGNGLDANGNSVVDLGTLTWSVIKNIGSIDAAGLFTAKKAREGFISVTSDLGPTAQTDTIFVIPAGIAYIETAPTATSVETDSTFQFSAGGYDSDSNLVYDITDSVTWTTTDPAGSVDAAGLYTAGNAPSPPTYYVKAVYGGSMSDSSDVTVISAGALSYIKIERENGTEFGDSTLSTDNDTTLFYCRAYDAGDALIGNVSVDWSIIGNDSIGTVAVGPDAFTQLTLVVPGTGRIVAAHLSGAVDTTGTLTSVAGVPVSITIIPDTATISADSTKQFTVQEYDADGNLSDSIITPSWSVLGGIGSIENSGEFTATTAGEGYIVAEGSGLVDTSGLITVSPGTLTSITIAPDSAEIGVGDSVQFTATGFDAKSNVTNYGNLTWMVLGQIGSIDFAGLLTTTQPGVCSVMVISSINNVSDISSAIEVKALFITSIPLGNQFVEPLCQYKAILAFRIENNYDDDKTINSITLRDASLGAGTDEELLSNIDSVIIYYDLDNDSSLSVSDSMIADINFNSDVITLSFDPVNIQSGSGSNFLISSDVSGFPHDGDSLDLYFLPAIDLLAAGGISIDGPDTLNSFGYNIVNGLVAGQISQLSTGVTQVSPGDTIYHVFTVDLPRNGYSDDSLNIFSLLNLGTAVETDLDSMVLYQDNGNNVWDGALSETALGQLVYTGSYWMRSGLSVPLTNQLNRFYVGVTVADYPENGATLELTIPANGLEMFSSNDGPIDSALTPPETITIVTSETLEISTHYLPSVAIRPGNYTDVLICLKFTNGYNSTVSFDSLRISLFATDPDGATQAQLDSQIDSVFLYLNRDSDTSTIGFADSLLASGVLTDGEVMFDLSGFEIISGGTRIHLCLMALMDSQNCKNDNLINIGLANETDIFSSAANISASFPVKNSEEHVIDIFRAADIVINNLSGSTIFGGQVNQPVLDFELPRNGYAVASLRKIKLTNDGTLDDKNSIEAVYLWADKSNDGFTPDDSLLGEFINGNNVWELAGLTYLLSSIHTRFIISIDILNGQFEGGTLNFEIPVGGVTYWADVVGPDDQSRGNQDVHMVFPSDRVTVISVPGPSQSLTPGSTGNVNLTFALYNGYSSQTKTLQALNITNISRTIADLAFVDYELGQVSLYVDTNGSRIYDNDLLTASGQFLTGNLYLTGLNIILPSEELTYLFITGDNPTDMIDSDSLAIEISVPSDFVFDGQVNINGDLPVTRGGYLIVDGSVHEQYNIIDITPGSLSPGDTSVCLFAFQPAFNGSQGDLLNKITINNTGDADTSDIAALELWIDINFDSIWQEADSFLTLFDYSNASWIADSLVVTIDSSRPVFFIMGDISATASSGRSFRAEVPINGCEYNSANDGPRDSALISSNSFIISTSGLRIDYTVLAANYSVGQTINVNADVTNLTGSTMDSVFGEIVFISDSTLVALTGSSGGPITLGPDQGTSFTFSYDAVSAGSVSWQIRAISPSVPDSSAIVQTNTIQIQNSPSDVLVQLINSTPTSVTRGQTNIFPLGIRLDHPDTSQSAASMRLDSLTLNVTDGASGSLPAGNVFSRMVLSNKLTNLTILDSVPMQSAVTLIFSQPVRIDPGEMQLFTLLVDIDSAATADNFAIELSNSSDLSVVDDNTEQSITIDSTITFPQGTAVCRIDNASRNMVLAYTVPHKGSANLGQDDVEILRLNVRHPGTSGSSPIQLSAITLEILDSLDQIINAQSVLDEIKLVRQQFVVGNIVGTDLNAMELDISLNAPLILNPGENDSLKILVSIRNESPYLEFNARISDSTSLLVRDASSGLLLATATDTLLAAGTLFPVLSGPVVIKQPALPIEICPTALVPAAVVGGTDSISLVELKFHYPPGGDHAPVHFSFVLISVLDTLDRPLDPDRLFDRIGAQINGAGIVYQSFIPLQNGMIKFELGNGGTHLAQGDSMIVQLIGDVEADAPYDHFVLKIPSESEILMFDHNDTTYMPGLAQDIGCGNYLPFATPLAKIFLPAGRPSLASPTYPVQLAYPGQTNVVLYEGVWNYSSLTLQGDLSIHSLTGQSLKRTSDGFVSQASGNIFETVNLIIDNEIVASDTTLADDTLRLYLDSAYNISAGNSLDIRLEANLKSDAVHGNYIIRFSDSTFLGITDKNLATAIYPQLSGETFPIYAIELSLVSGSLEHSFTNFPNPFNPNSEGYTTIGYVLSEDAQVDIDIFTITGDRVSHLVENSQRSSGQHQSDRWFGNNGAGIRVISGTYYCRITARYNSGRTEEFVRKIAVVR